MKGKFSVIAVAIAMTAIVSCKEDDALSPPDVQPPAATPSVIFLSPSDGSIVLDNVRIELKIVSSDVVSRVEVAIDGIIDSSMVLHSPPYTLIWNCAATPDSSPHELTAMAYTDSGSMIASRPLHVVAFHLAPSGLTAGLISATEISLSWKDNSSKETGYDLEYSVNGGAFQLINTMPANTTTASVSGIFPVGDSFGFRVRAFRDTIKSGYTNIAVVSNVQPTRYFLGGMIVYRSTGVPVLSTSERVVIQLDSNRSFTADYGGSCNYGFYDVSAGRHHIHITGPSIIPLDTEISVDHDADCYTGASTYNFLIEIGLANNGRELIVPQNIGATWRFAFQRGYSSAPSASTQTTSGSHTWQVVSSNINATGTVLQILDARNDTIHSQTPVLDTTWIQRDTVYFPITITQDSLTFDCPELVGPEYRTLPRYCLQGSDTVLISYPARPGFDGSFAQYANHIGIIGHGWGAGGNTRVSQSFKLIEFLGR
jgi:hypothetical protein